MLKTVLNWFGISHATVSNRTIGSGPPSFTAEPKTERPKRTIPNSRTARCWLEARPEIKTQVDTVAREGTAQYAKIHKWLVNEHAFPYSDESFRRYVHHVVLGKSKAEVYDMAKLTHIQRKRS